MVPGPEHPDPSGRRPRADLEHGRRVLWVDRHGLLEDRGGTFESLVCPSIAYSFGGACLQALNRTVQVRANSTGSREHELPGIPGRACLLDAPRGSVLRATAVGEVRR